jgi:hypothetical protein
MSPGYPGGQQTLTLKPALVVKGKRNATKKQKLVLNRNLKLLLQNSNTQNQEQLTRTIQVMELFKIGKKKTAVARLCFGRTGTVPKKNLTIPQQLPMPKQQPENYDRKRNQLRMC